MAEPLHGQADDVPDIPGYAGWSRLGQGGFARVYAARRECDGRDVAVKLALRRGDPRFAREANALRRLGPPIAPALLDTGTTAEHNPFLVMELVRGESLTRWLSAQRGHPLEARITLIAALARAVDVVHARGLVHRDLKPDNVIIRDADGGKAARAPEPCLLDFGLARLVSPAGPENAEGPDVIEAELTIAGAQIGTALYMSPEQCEGRPADARTDIYALGVILFEALVGRPPFEGDRALVLRAHASRSPPPPSRLAGTPPAFDTVVLRCLSKRPDERFQRALDVAEALATALAEAPASVPVSVPLSSIPIPPSSAPGSMRPPPSAPRPPGAQRSAARKPVALLVLRTATPVATILGALGDRDAHVARTFEACCLFAFPRNASAGAGVSAALRAVARVLDVTEDATVHVVSLAMRESARGLMLLGSDLDQVDAWAPRRGERGVTLTPAAIAALAATDTAGPSAAIETPRSLVRSSGTVTATIEPSLPSAPPLVGREELLRAIDLEADESLRERTPVLSTIVAEVGHGKTRVAEELGRRLADRFSAVAVVQAPPPEQGGAEWLATSLARLAFDLPNGPLEPSAVREACTARLGAAPGEALWTAVAQGLGVIGEADPALAPLRGTPGALRRARARAIGLGLAARAASGPLAVIVDDAHFADPTSLDALEIASLSGQPGALWIGVLTNPTLLAQRPMWGERAARHLRHDLGPLGEEAVRQLLRSLLWPVEIIPDPVVERLFQMTSGVPLFLVEVAHALRMSGRIRRHKDTGGCYLAADELMEMSATPVSERLARRVIAELPEPLLELLRIACVLGAEVDRADVAAVQCLLEAETPSAEAMDPGVGLDRLAMRSVLLPVSGNRYRFRHTTMRDALEGLMAPSMRRRYHAAVLRHLEGMPGQRVELLPRIARHAAVSGARGQAAGAYLELAETAARRHGHMEAEAFYSSALELLEEAQAEERERALSGRGQARAFLERYDDALEDLRKAQGLAAARGDDRTVASLLLDEATLYDLHNDHAVSAEAVEQAAPLVERLGEAALMARLASARGRTHWRHGRTPEAIAELGRGADMAAELDDRRTQTESLLLLSTALVAGQRIDDAARRFEEVIALCTRTGDRFHLAMAHINRIWLWIKRQDHERAVADQRVALAVARELGNATLEAWATGNVAELLYYGGAYDEALPLARRMDELMRRLHARPLPEAVVIRARLEAVLGYAEEARALVQPFLLPDTGEATKPFVRSIARLVEMLIGDPRAENPTAWDALVEELVLNAETDEWPDALYHATDHAVKAGRVEEARMRIARAREQIHAPMWRRRFDALSARLGPG
jgi:serine/threonine protein kinase/tetratricopeptide (TPR) repeat protein